MIRYGPRWWKARFWWQFRRLMAYLMSPCWPMWLVWKLDVLLFGQKHGPLCRFYDIWTMRLSVMSGGWWRDAAHGSERRAP